jgi:dTDP-L-rhamnose 4-epimerase
MSMKTARVAGGDDLTGTRVLVTGGAGFIGSHLVDALLERGAHVRILDNLDPQVHANGAPPRWLPEDAELRIGDVRDRGALQEALRGMDIVYHLAATLGVRQSMHRIADCTATNTMATAGLLQTLVDERIELQRLVVASSMAVYGEGLYRHSDGEIVERVMRSPHRLSQRRWEPADEDEFELEPLPTPEWKRLDPTSVYALTKADQERLALLVGSAYGIPTTALRLFNVYGPRQALSNPYTKMMATFSSRLLEGKAPLLFEDGAQQRDFVSVHDVVRALLLAGEREHAVGQAVNIGSGSALTVRDLAEGLARALDVPIAPKVTGRYRMGDIRHLTADIRLARERLGYEPTVPIERGLSELVEWLSLQERTGEGVEQHAAVFAGHGLSA